MTDVFMNSRFVGTVKDGKDFRQQLVSERRAGKLSEYVNIHYDEKRDELFLETAAGRSVRPLLVCKEASCSSPSGTSSSCARAS